MEVKPFEIKGDKEAKQYFRDFKKEKGRLSKDRRLIRRYSNFRLERIDQEEMATILLEQ